MKQLVHDPPQPLPGWQYFRLCVPELRPGCHVLFKLRMYPGMMCGLVFGKPEQFLTSRHQENHLARIYLQPLIINPDIRAPLMNKNELKLILYTWTEGGLRIIDNFAPCINVFPVKFLHFGYVFRKSGYGIQIL